MSSTDVQHATRSELAHATLVAAQIAAGNCVLVRSEVERALVTFNKFLAMNGVVIEENGTRAFLGKLGWRSSISTVIAGLEDLLT